MTLKNHEDKHRIEERELKQDNRALKVEKKEQEVRQQLFLDSLIKVYNNNCTIKRKEFERVSNEIQLNFKHKMFLLRSVMERKRKDAITAIQDKKDAAI